jgi:glutamine synthetase
MADAPFTGMMSLADLKQAHEAETIETVLAVFPDLYGRLVGKRFTSHYFLNHVAEEGTHACNYLLACDMEMDPVPGYAFTSWETGYGDFHLIPDMATLRQADWLSKTALVLCDLVNDPNAQPVEISPRQMLRRQIERAATMGFTVMGAAELELYVFNETYETARDKRYHDLKTAGRYIEDYHILQGTKEEDLIGAIRRGLDRSGIPVECSKGEWGPGQQEINIAYSEALHQADRCALLKHAAKEIALLQGKAITFMAKWDETLAGSSMHLHLSLRDGKGQSAFSGGVNQGNLNANDLFRWFLGGWMQHAREFACFYAPYVSSYKRYQATSFAPTGIAWSYDNRTAGFRVVGGGPSLRIECRLPGADANPYLAFASAIAAGLDGLENRTEPPRMFNGDVYNAKDLPRVPGALREAITELENSATARKAFGDDVVNHYLHFFRTEQRKFDEVVTCWERERFFERA